MSADTYLTSVPRVKEWLAIANNTTMDTLLDRMIRSVSAFVLKHLNRDGLSLTEYTDVYDGYGNGFMTLRRNPVYSVEAMSFSGVPQQAAAGDGFASPYTNGWVIEPYSVFGGQRLTLYGKVFPRGRGSVAIRYKSGFVVVDEQHTIPATPYAVETVNFWLGDISVTGPGGTPLVKVDASPTTGQYSVSDGVYTFAAADTGDVVLITYSYVPADIENAVIEIVGERYKYMDRIGVLSKALGGQETVSFSQKSMSSFISDNLTPYINVVPV